MKWVQVISEVVDNKVSYIKETLPKQSGVYLCTCVHSFCGKLHKYLTVLEYDADLYYFHDVNRCNALSHTILGWADNIEFCDDSNLEYKKGKYFIRKEAEV